jgi:SAM-dependent methyltransferase
MKLHVGCGAGRLEGWVNCDKYAAPNVDLVFDLEAPWPFEDDSVEAIYGSHVLEHLARFPVFFDEAHRVLIDQGEMHLRVPYGMHRAAWWDPTHVRPWVAESFCHLQPGYQEAIANRQHQHLRRHWEVVYTQLRLCQALAPVLKRTWQRRLVVPFIKYLTDVFEELFVGLKALKTPASLATFTRDAAAVPVQYIMYEHDLEQRPIRAGEELVLLRIATGQLAGAYIVGKG